MSEPKRKIVGGITFECIGGTPAPDGGTHGECWGHFPPCAYCKQIPTDLEVVSLDEVLGKSTSTISGAER